MRRSGIVTAAVLLLSCCLSLAIAQEADAFKQMLEAIEAGNYEEAQRLKESISEETWTRLKMMAEAEVEAEAGGIVYSRGIDYGAFILDDTKADGSSKDPKSGYPIVSLARLEKSGEDWSGKYVSAVFFYLGFDTDTSRLPRVKVRTNGEISKVIFRAASWIRVSSGEKDEPSSHVFATAAYKDLLLGLDPQRSIVRCDGLVVKLLKLPGKYGLVCSRIEDTGLVYEDGEVKRP